MKWIFGLTFVTMILVVSSKALGESSLPSQKEVTTSADKETYRCEYESGDVGTITGVGNSPAQALANASEQCFERRVSLYERLRRKKIDEDRGLTFIDSCVNITCG